jgi:sugar lactone lactonase YvrE
VDIKGHQIYRLDPASGERRSWDAPGQIGFLLPAARGGFVAGLQQGLFRFDERDGSFAELVRPEPDRPGNRLNDAAVDPQGRLWFGSMDDGETAPTGTIYRLADDGSCVAATPRCSITNGPAISPDGRTLYHVDTLAGIIHACALSADGSLSDSRELVRIPSSEGYPDGPAVDAEGCLWIGLYGGWGARRYAPNGELLETVPFPVSAVTKLAFGGPDLRTVFATTANKHLDKGGLEREPLAGNLFSFDAAVPGQSGHEIAIGL